MSDSIGQAADEITEPRRFPGRPAAAPCHICKKPQPPCPHEGCYRHYSNGHQNVQTLVVLDERGEFKQTKCVACGAGFGSSFIPHSLLAALTDEGQQ